eukprot:TRINITY_DN3723_c0_g1_i10.p1 TRINITY_DN3723_c0_g1~~TRINITY_DN3723_c0_g1_i10.p1  ORF type:complete len:457 (+),score=23.09 TRINITY_DN3723_c0_g1_i10:1013-2383(+)
MDVTENVRAMVHNIGVTIQNTGGALNAQFTDPHPGQPKQFTLVYRISGGEAVTVTSGENEGDINVEVNVGAPVVNRDDDGVLLSDLSGTVDETGAVGTFTVVLGSQPSGGSVAVAFSSSDTTEGTINPSSLSFTTATWAVPQTVSVTGLDDDIDDGDVGFTIDASISGTMDVAYANLQVLGVLVTNINDDTAGVTVGSISGNTGEDGTTATFTVKLDTDPVAEVVIALESNDISEGTVNPSALTFEAGDGTWTVDQTVIVVGLNDNIDDGDATFSIVASISSMSDHVYEALSWENLLVTNRDDDTARIVFGYVSGKVDESGSTARFTVKLDTEPTGDVIVEMRSSNEAEGQLSPQALTFGVSEWSWERPQTVSVWGIDDSITDGNTPFAVYSFTDGRTLDPNYANVLGPRLDLTNYDNDFPPIPAPPPVPPTRQPPTAPPASRNALHDWLGMFSRR